MKNKYIKAPILSTAFSESEKSARSRFKNILSERGKAGIVIIVILAIVVIIATAFVSINRNEKETVVPHVEETNISKEKQLKVILDNQSMWSLASDGESHDTYGYAVTDLDQNGRLEIIASSCNGTGLYTHTKYYEVNENADGLTLITTNLKEDDIETYIMDTTVKVFYDKAKNEYHYLFTNINRNDATSYNQGKYEIVLKNQKIMQNPLAYKNITYKENETYTEMAISDANGETLTDESYERYEYIHYKDMEYKLANIEWINGYTLDENDKTNLENELKKSFDAFKFGAPELNYEKNEEYSLEDKEGNKIFLNDSIKNVNKTLVASKYNSSDGFQKREYAYEDLRIEGILATYIDDYYIMTIETESPNYKTKRGIAVGDTLEKLKEVYSGNLEKVPTDVNEITYCYPYTDFISITFNIIDGKISKITLKNNLC